MLHIAVFSLLTGLFLCFHRITVICLLTGLLHCLRLTAVLLLPANITVLFTVRSIFLGGTFILVQHSGIVVKLHIYQLIWIIFPVRLKQLSCADLSHCTRTVGTHPAGKITAVHILLCRITIAYLFADSRRKYNMHITHCHYHNHNMRRNNQYRLCNTGPVPLLIHICSLRVSQIFSTLYPTPHTTLRYLGSFGLISIFSRICLICTATVLSTPMASSFQMLS